LHDPIDNSVLLLGSFTCSEHCGTHVDAPYHFSEGGQTVDQISLSNLISECRVIDISAKCLSPEGRDYALTAEDILEHEALFGILLSGTIVLIRTGWSKYYPKGSIEYLGFDHTSPYDPATSNLNFPGIGVDAANLFIERQISAVGLDTGL